MTIAHPHKNMTYQLIITLCLLSIGTTDVFGNVEDSLRNLILERSGKAKIETQSRLAQVLINKGNKEAGRQLLQSILPEAQHIDVDSLTLSLLIQLGNSYSPSKADSAIRYYNQAIDLAKKWKMERWRWETVNLKARMWAKAGQPDKALHTFRTTLAATYELGLPRIHTNTLLGLANTFTIIGQPDSAIQYLKKYITYARQHQTNPWMGLMNLAIVYDYQGQSDSALWYYLDAKAAADSTGNSAIIGRVLANLGTFYDDRGDLNMALNYYNKAYEHLLSVQMLDPAYNVKYNSSRILQQQEQFDAAREEFGAIIQFARQSNDLHLEARALINVAESWLVEGYLDRTDSLLQIIAEDSSRWTNPMINLALAELTTHYLLERERFAEALTLARQIQQKASRLNQALYAISACHKEVEILRQSGRCEEALQVGKACLRNPAYADYLTAQANIHTTVIECLHTLGRYQEIYPYYQQKMEILDSLAAQQNEQHITTQLLQQKQLEYRQLQNQLATHETQLQLEQAISQRRGILIIGTLVVLVIVLLLLAVVFRSRKRLHTINRKLRIQNQQIEAQNDYLQRTNAEHHQLLHAVTHDLKSPFNAIQGFVEILQMEDNLSEEQRQHLLYIQKSVTQGQATINDLLQLDAGAAQTVEVTSFDAIAMLEELRLVYLRAADKKNIQLTHDYQIETLFISSDPNKLRRILDNILSNAVKFTPKGGKVTITVSAAATTSTVAITDTGPGISAADQDKMYQQFTKLAAQPTGGETSTGLGLAIARNLATILGVDLQMDSTPGQGTRFTIVIPKKWSGQPINR